MNSEPFVFDFGMKRFQLEDWKEVVSMANSSNQEVYCWKTIGIENWLEKGLSISNVLVL